MGKLSELEITEIIKLYTSEIPSTHKLAAKFKVGHKRISSILKDNNITINKLGGQVVSGNTAEIEKSNVVRYESKDENNKLVAICKSSGVKFDDANNLSGCLTRHIIELYGDVPIPTNTYQRKKYEQNFGKKWFEEYFDIKEVDVVVVVMCGLCNWTTEDLDNKTGSFTKHINNYHNLTISEYLELHPDYSNLWLNKLNREELLSSKQYGVVCLECEEVFLGLTDTHMLSSHGMTIDGYKEKWGDDVQVFSDKTIDKLHTQAIEINKNMVHSFISKPQQEIREFIESELGLGVLNNNKKLLSGVELDIFIPSHNVAIEYNGLYWHTERLGKHKNYHLDKTNLSDKEGIRLIHIFEDEWKNKKEIVKNRIRHILGYNNVSIYARKCIIKEIDVELKDKFLLETHIQGVDKSSIRLGAFFNDELVSVMTFSKLRKVMGSKKVSGEYELVRFSSVGVVGIAGKLLKYFIRNYEPSKITSYADRRWSKGEVYETLGFKMINMGRPNYWYTKGYKKREYRYNYRKDILVSKGYDKSKTEMEIMSELGYDVIWDCGSIKYEMEIIKY